MNCRENRYIVLPTHPYQTGGGGIGVQIGGGKVRWGRDVMAIMKVVLMACSGCIIGNPSEDG